ncbi:glycosyltransferase family 4 protein [Chryseobacterium binzhouense]|uniref:glycosyltransferase family 4 protein n=1 Tax=Chryseobacterium binzhouense TaxID=2593646 RepID=UPI0011809A9F|nr:glycosyltransferase family 4 protein [Chryseobacterium binzhouense]
MGIVHLILGKANPEKMNGVNKVVYNIATKQAENRQDVEVWGISENTEINYPERNFRTKIFKRRKNPFSIPEDLQNEIINSEESTVFHLHGGWIPVFATVSRFLRKHNFTYIITPHGAYNAVAMQKSILTKKVYFELFEKTVIKNASNVHCIGESEMEGLQSIFPTRKGTLIPYGLERIKDDLSFSSQKETLIFGFVGRLDIYTKGLDLLVESFAEFSKADPDSKLWIIGDSNEKAELHQKIKTLGIEEKTVLFGSKFGEEKNDLLKKMDVFVHPSRNEGLPVSVIEAANFGKPCIVTKNTNIGYLVEQFNAGINIPFPEKTLLTKAFFDISKIWKDRQNYEKICGNAVKMVEEAFDWNYILDEMNSKLYNC